MDFNRRTQDLNRLTEQLDGVRAEGTVVMQTQVALVTQVAYATSDEAVEKWAYENGHWVRVGEHPVDIIAGGSVTPTPSPPLTPQVQDVPNWRTWWELFFGDR
jgi:hypothetical protein